MAGIALVVEIPEEIYKASQIIDVKHEDVVQIPLEVIKNGTLLPKGHGRIGDLDAISLDDINFFSIGDYCKMARKLTDAPTIIEADKAETEET